MILKGVNAYISENPHLPIEFYIFNFKPKPFNIVDVLAWAKVMALDLSLNMKQEIERYDIKNTQLIFSLFRYKLLMIQKLSPERINKLWPPYPKKGLTILSELDLNNNSLLTKSHFIYNENEIKRLKKEQIVNFFYFIVNLL